MTKRAKQNRVKQKSGLNRALLDIAPGRIRLLLERKSAWYGCDIIVVPAANTSRRCADCGHLPAKNEPENRESQARFVCKQCGHAANADHNAARNILEAAGSAATACQVPETHSMGTDGSNRKKAA